MRLDDVAATCLVAACLVAAAPGLRAAPDPEAAEAAFDAGESAKALALYDEILAANPDDIDALLRSGKLLSWDRKYDEALARYDRALGLDPGNERVLLERGKVLLWSQRYDDAIASFGLVLNQNPKEPWALCGTAQSYAWRGQNAKARPFYERALAADPNLKEAQLGLAYVDLEQGDTSAALARSAALKAKYPDDPEVVELDRAVRRARAPWVQVDYDHANDSDGNSMNTYGAEGGFALPARMDLRFGYAYSDLQGPTTPPFPVDPDADASAETLYGVWAWQPKAGHRGEFRLGAMRLTDTSGIERTTGIGGITYAFPMATWTGRATAGFDPFLYSPEILDNEIDVASVTFAASGLAAPRVKVEADAGYGDFSDGNTRWNADAGAWYVWKWPRRTLMTGAAARYLTFTENVNHGYFDPSNLIAAIGSLRSNGAIGSSKWEYEASVEAGAQWYTFDGAEATGKPLWNLYGLVARPLPHGISLQIYSGYGNTSTASGPGFTSFTVGARVRFTIGG
jgi:tetratricopeptide (TPR) repeat protein